MDGTAGNGGDIKVSENVQVYAFNGKFKKNALDLNIITNCNSECVIYAQIGYSLIELNKDKTIYHSNCSPFQKYNNGDLTITRISDTLEFANNTQGMISYLQNNYRTITYQPYIEYGKIGIGSGAGFKEYDNGTYTVDSSMN